jgi:hypothetical protein
MIKSLSPYTARPKITAEIWLYFCVSLKVQRYPSSIRCCCHTLTRFQQPTVENVQNILLELLEDEKPIAKRPSTLMEFSACLLQQQTFADFKNPDR